MGKAEAWYNIFRYGWTHTSEGDIKYQQPLDDKAQTHYHQPAKDLYLFFILKHAIRPYMKLLTEIWNSSPQNICDVFVKAVIEIIVTIGSLKLLLTYTRPVLNGETLTLSWRRPLSYRNQSIDLIRKSMDWFLYDKGLRQERVKGEWPNIPSKTEYSVIIPLTVNQNAFLCFSH